MTKKYLLVLAIGHILGDFYFQTDKIAQKKESCLSGVFVHSIEYTLSLVLVMVPIISSDMIKGALFLSLTHFIIDTVKYILLKKGKVKKSAKLFIYDQLAHLVCILITAYMMYMYDVKITAIPLVDSIQLAFGFQKEVIARWALALLFIHKPSNILIQNILSKKRNDNDTDNDDIKAGRKIGSIERLIMLLFISMEQYTAMGVVLTAKSIARFDKIANDEKFAEYYLLGTLISTACVILCKGILL